MLNCLPDPARIAALGPGTAAVLELPRLEARVLKWHFPSQGSLRQVFVAGVEVNATHRPSQEGK